MVNNTVVTTSCPQNSYYDNATASCLCNVGHSQSYGGASLTHRYSFNDGTAIDSVAGANGVFLSGAYSYINQVMLWPSSGVTPYVQLPSNVFSASSLTIEAWFSTGSSNTGWNRICQFGSNSRQNQNSLNIARNSNNGYICVQLFSRTGTSYTLTTTTRFTSQSNMYIAVTFSVSTSVVISIYINGALSVTGSTSIAMTNSSAGGYLGKSFFSTDPASQISIDEFRIWTGVLTSSSISQSYKYGPNTLGCPSCQNGTYSEDLGATSCSSCPANSNSGTSAQSCLCNAGYNTTGYGTTLTCNACPGGTYSTKASNCRICSEGYYSPQASGACRLTPAGYYSLVQSSTYSPCAADTFSPNGSASCYACISGSSSASTSGSCTCYAGYAQQGYSSTLTCALCPVTTYSPSAGYPTCLSCPPGTYTLPDAGATYCPICPIATYSISSDDGSIVCKACPAGRTTAITGASSENECLDPTLNFVVGSILLVLCWVFLILLCVKDANVIGKERRTALSQKLADHLNLYYDSAVELQAWKKLNRKPSHSWRHWITAVKTIFKFLLVFFLAICAIIIKFVVVVNNIFFSALILARGYHRFGFFLHIAYVKTIKALIDKIDVVLRPLVPFVKMIFVPVIACIEGLNLFDFDYRNSLTCQGAQAPVEMAIDIVIFFSVMIIAEADFALLLSHTMIHTFQKYAMSALRRFRIVSGLFTFIIYGLLYYNPWKIALQYFMSLVRMLVFVQDNGIHSSTAACNRIEGAENIDYAFAFLTSLFAYALCPLVCYSVSKIIHPGLPSDDNDFDGIFKINDDATDSKDSSDNNDAMNTWWKELYIVRFFTYFGESMLTLLSKVWIDNLIFQFFIWLAAKFMTPEVIPPYIKKKDGNPAAENNASTAVDDVGAAVKGNNNKYDDGDAEGESKVDSYTKGSEDTEEVNHHRVAKKKEKRVSLVDPSIELIENPIHRKKSADDSAGSYFKSKDAEQTTSQSVFAQPLKIRAYELPSYRRLSEVVAADLEDTISFTTLRLFISITPLGHLLTPVGRAAWNYVLWKYYVFAFLSVGIWNDNSALCFGLPKRALELMHPMMLQAHYLDTIGLMISSRAILWQLVPGCTAVSTFALMVGNSPIYLTPEMQHRTIQRLDDPSVNLVLTDLANYVRSRPSEMLLTVEEELSENWSITFTKWCKFFTQTKQFKLPFNILNFLIAFLIVVLPSEFWDGKQFLANAAIIWLLIYSIIQSLIHVAVIATALGIRDSDMELLLLCCCLTSAAGVGATAPALRANRRNDVEDPSEEDQESIELPSGNVKSSSSPSVSAESKSTIQTPHK